VRSDGQASTPSSQQRCCCCLRSKSLNDSSSLPATNQPGSWLSHDSPGQHVCFSHSNLTKRFVTQDGAQLMLRTTSSSPIRAMYLLYVCMYVCMYVCTYVLNRAQASAGVPFTTIACLLKTASINPSLGTSLSPLIPNVNPVSHAKVYSARWKCLHQHAGFYVHRTGFMCRST
jgi:hypothetical protein